ncbi:preprotein translocase subunit SecE [Lysinibacillus piscis]|uniref:Protein translocase subunit SecE n=1 Tax=Lysinibacillus piscis TaxID=2518931 RepID=A0ABQ5NNR2_9BACI|nr:preprotein translocase subunit SecE [Lysinibacillus sp. KH24]GLC89983.1 protein translocase subunit SecE [Lysinibacillus sp. KH24]
MGKIKSFFSDVMSEMRKTSWPKSKELTKYTTVVIATVVVMAIFFVLTDLGISSLFRWFLDL